MEEQRKFGEVLQEAYQQDKAMRELKKQIFTVQSKIQKVNLEKSKITAELVQLKTEIEQRKLDIQEEISFSR